MEAYEGKEKYIFVSYAHKDSSVVLPIINKMQAEGFRIWFDQGIEAGTEWPEYIAEHLMNCSSVLVFMSNHAANSVNCRNEINFALKFGKEVLIVYLGKTDLTAGLELQIGTLQSMFKYNHTTEESFFRELNKARILADCKVITPEFEAKMRTAAEEKIKAEAQAKIEAEIRAKLHSGKKSDNDQDQSDFAKSALSVSDIFRNYFSYQKAFLTGKTSASQNSAKAAEILCILASILMVISSYLKEGTNYYDYISTAGGIMIVLIPILAIIGIVFYFKEFSAYNKYGIKPNKLNRNILWFISRILMILFIAMFAKGDTAYTTTPYIASFIFVWTVHFSLLSFIPGSCKKIALSPRISIPKIAVTILSLILSIVLIIASE